MPGYGDNDGWKNEPRLAWVLLLAGDRADKYQASVPKTISVTQVPWKGVSKAIVCLFKEPLTYKEAANLMRPAADDEEMEEKGLTDWGIKGYNVVPEWLHLAAGSQLDRNVEHELLAATIKAQLTIVAEKRDKKGAAMHATHFSKKAGKKKANEPRVSAVVQDL